MAASSFTRPVWRSISINATVSTPVAAALMSSSGLARSLVTKNATTMPGRMACVMASDSIVTRRSTRKTPGSAHAAAVTAAISWISRPGDIGGLSD